MLLVDPAGQEEALRRIDRGGAKGGEKRLDGLATVDGSRQSDIPAVLRYLERTAALRFAAPRIRRHRMRHQRRPPRQLAATELDLFVEEVIDDVDPPQARAR